MPFSKHFQIEHACKCVGNKQNRKDAQLSKNKNPDSKINVNENEQEIENYINEINTTGIQTIEGKKIKSATIEQKAVIPSSRIKPKKLLVVVIAFILGLIIAILWALIKGAVDNHRNREMLDSEED